MKQIIDEIRRNSGTNAKLSLLEAQKDNLFLRSYLRMTYEPKINFYIKKVDTTPVSMSMFGLSTSVAQKKFDEEVMAEVFNKIAKREITGGAARRWLSNLYQELDSDGKELLAWMIQRDLRAGISTTSINKVWPGLITDVPYMRCCLPKDAKLKDWNWKDGIYSQIKADGMFANVTHHPSGVVTIETRAGSPMPLDAFSGLENEIKTLVPAGQQLHGELLMTKGGIVLAREVGNGLFNTLLQEGELEKGYEPIFQAWDMIPLTEARPKNKYNVPYKERFKALNRLFVFEMDAGRPPTRHLQLIEYKLVYSLKEAYEHCKEAMLRKLEGTVIKNPNEAIWEDTTSKYQVKLKLEFAVELRVVGFRAADAKSKNAKTFGSMLCESECGKLKVGVTGLKDDVRAAIWDDRELWAGFAVISVTSNGIMEAKEENDGYCSLFLPRFTERRLDKNEADTLARIREIQTAAIDTLVATAGF